VREMMKTTIGTIHAVGKEGMPLEEPTVMKCRRTECLSGNIAADSLRIVPFEDAQIALVSGGTLRTSLPGGAVTPGHVLGTLPFQNMPLITNMLGSVLLQALEHGVSRYGEDEGRFLQVSGLRYAFNPSGKPGSRITRAEVPDKDGQWRPLDNNALYRVVILDFLARGGDGFSMFIPLKWEEGDKLASDVLRVYLERHSPVEATLQGRVSIQR